MRTQHDTMRTERPTAWIPARGSCPIGWPHMVLFAACSQQGAGGPGRDGSVRRGARLPERRLRDGRRRHSCRPRWTGLAEYLNRTRTASPSRPTQTLAGLNTRVGSVGRAPSRPPCPAAAQYGTCQTGMCKSTPAGTPSSLTSDARTSAQGTTRRSAPGVLRPNRGTSLSACSSTSSASLSNANALTQTMHRRGPPTSIPRTGEIRIRFAVAPVLRGSGHASNQQPYFFVQAHERDEGQRGPLPGRSASPKQQPASPGRAPVVIGGNTYRYTDWQLIDIAPGAPNDQPSGDMVELEDLIAAEAAPSAATGAKALRRLAAPPSDRRCPGSS